MGAAACQATCMSKKYAKPTGKEPIKVLRKPGVVDLDSSLDDYEAHLLNRNDLLAPRIDGKESQVCIHFIEEQLIN